MPRRARLVLPNVAIHIIQRGNNRQACFYTDEDYRFYLHWLDKSAEKAGCQVHAYVLMTNHLHLLISGQHGHSAAALMKALGQRYVQYVNRTYRRSGTLWVRPVSLVPHAGGDLFARLPALHRTEPGVREHGGASGGVLLVELPGTRAG